MRDKTWSTKIDSGILEGVIGLTLLLVGLFGALFPILGVTGPFPPTKTREVHIDGVAQVHGLTPSGGLTLRGVHRAELVLAHPDLGQRVLLILPDLVGTLLFLSILTILLRVARTFREGDVFAPHNSTRLMVIAVEVLLIGTIPPLLTVVTTNALVSGTKLAGAVSTVYQTSMQYVLLAVLIAAVAWAFRHGTRLRADTEGLV
ncbi:MAG: DUF2975 domain-containing protein [Actinocatenispora sp.]